MSSSGDKENGDDEDGALWAHVTRDIEPFHDQEAPPAPEQRASTKKKKTGAAQQVSRDVSAVKSSESRAASGYEVDGRTAQRIRQGKMPIEARLDLHFMTQDEARMALERFIVNSYEQGRRHVLVITGKGSRGAKDDKDWMQERPGVLKRRVPDWLAETPLREIVLQFHKARPQHGGDGALYILLRRKR